MPYTKRMKIEWNKVTWYSKLAAVIIYVGTFAIAFYLGRMYEAQHPAYDFSAHMQAGGVAHPSPVGPGLY